jgi:hypothetical protein
MSDTAKPDSWQPAAEMTVGLYDNWFDPIESEVRARAREFIEEMIRGELDTTYAVSDRYVRPDRDCRAARQAEHRRRQDDGVEEQGAAPL